MESKTKRFNRVIQRIIEQPKVIKARIKGLYSCHVFTCLTAKDLVNQPIKTIIDIGANDGRFIRASKYVFPEAKIYGFEPQKRLYNLIKEIPNTAIFNIGLWDQEGIGLFYLNENNEDASSFLKPQGEYEEDAGRVSYLVKIKQQRFDKLNIKIKRPCFVKVDVEGAEEFVLKGFGDRLNEVDVIQVELIFKDYYRGQTKLSSLLELLEQYGFTKFLQKEVVYVGNTLTNCDLIFYKEEAQN